MLRQAFLATDEAISAEEGCTATAVLMWRDGQGAVCLQVGRARRRAALGLQAGRAAVAQGAGIPVLDSPRPQPCTLQPLKTLARARLLPCPALRCPFT